MSPRSFIALTSMFFVATSAASAATPDGCFARTYDKAHLASHKGQIVTSATLKVSASTTTYWSIDAILNLKVRGQKISFRSLGACNDKGGVIYCNGSDSAAEADPCPVIKDGVQDCRQSGQGAGRFVVTPKDGGVVITIPYRLELPEANEDSGPPFLYLSAKNKENNAFLLKPASAAACK